MFEKEAEEYADKVYENRTEMDYYGIAGAFQDGAEFAYNKANEWHDLRKNPNDLPKEDLRQRTYGYYLTASKHKSYKGFVFEVAYFTGVIFTRGGNILDNIIAWKEIVPPKGSVINDYS